jgi:biotin carboxyl carrier protein
MKLKIENKEISVKHIKNSVFKVNNTEEEIDLIKIDTSMYNIIYNHKNYNITVLEQNEEFYKISLNNIIKEVKITSLNEEIKAILGINELSNQQINEIKAPMPGKVIEVFVKVGDLVNEHDSILILEAMKMENNIKSPIQGVIKKITIQKNDTVQKNEILIEFK